VPAGGIVTVPMRNVFIAEDDTGPRRNRKVLGSIDSPI
jgi:hypothetical protein